MTAWREEAVCRRVDSKIFHEGAWDSATEQRTDDFEVARALCLACPVRRECAGLALSLPPDQCESVFAGLDPVQIRGAIANGLSVSETVKLAETTNLRKVQETRGIGYSSSV